MQIFFIYIIYISITNKLLFAILTTIYNQYLMIFIFFLWWKKSEKTLNKKKIMQINKNNNKNNFNLKLCNFILNS